MTNARNAQPSHEETELTTRQAAQILGVAQVTVRANAARLGGRKVMGRWRWPAAKVRAAAAGNPTPEQ